MQKHLKFTENVLLIVESWESDSRMYILSLLTLILL